MQYPFNGLRNLSHDFTVGAVFTTSSSEKRFKISLVQEDWCVHDEPNLEQDFDSLCNVMPSLAKAAQMFSKRLNSVERQS